MSLIDKNLTLRPKLGLLKAASPPRRPSPQEQAPRSSDRLDLSAAQDGKRSIGLGLVGKLLTLGMMATALVGCAGGAAPGQAVAQQLSEPAVIEKLQPANPFELMRMKDGSIAISADLKHDDAYVLAADAAIRQDGGVDIAVRTDEGTTLCEQAEALGGRCLNEEQVVVSDPSGSLLIETFAREGQPIHRLEAKPAGDTSAAASVDLNKLPDGTEVFSDNGSGLLLHNGELQLYPGFQ